VGLVEGLLVDSAVTVAALAFLATTGHLPRPVKIAFLAAAVFWTGYAVANNVHAALTMGIPLAGN